MITLTVFNTQVRIRPVILINVMGLWVLTTWVGLYRDPQRGLLLGLAVGFIAAFLLLVADIGHALAHIFSARYAGAPMDLILLSAGMPRTLYFDDEVSPRAHRLRALGGPIFSALGLLVSAAAYAAFSSDPVGWELAVWSLLGHGGILAGSLLPLPVVDGGVFLKWTLVARGRAEAEADEVVRRVDWGLGLLGAALGVWFIAAGMWIAAIIALGIGGVAIAVAAGWLR